MSQARRDQRRRRLLRLLVVDDNEGARTAMRAFLETVPNVAVFEATNGQEALVAAQAVRPDVVLIDVQMPVMDGLEATRHIKEQHPAVRVVILTMHAQYRQQALAAGADHFLLKGSPPQSLLTAVFNREDGRTGDNL